MGASLRRHAPPCFADEEDSLQTKFKGSRTSSKLATATSRGIIGTKIPLKESSCNSAVFCERISSVEAASLIRYAYGYKPKRENDDDVDVDGTLLIITSDASRGANRHTGLSSILRLINNTNTWHKDRSESGTPTRDNVHIATRRVQSTDAKDIFKSEVAAIALGARTTRSARTECAFGQQHNNTNVLFLTDSTSALDFYCGHQQHHHKQNHEQSTAITSATLLNDPNFKAMQALIRQQMNEGGGNESNKRRVFMAKVRSNKFETDGFFDHDATDIISSLVKIVPNKKIHHMYTCTNSYADEDGRESGPIPTSARQVMVPPLRDEDIKYLSRSEDSASLEHEELNLPKKPQVLMKKQRGARLERTKVRMRDEFGIDFNRVNLSTMRTSTKKKLERKKKY